MKDMIRNRWFLASLAVLILTGMIILSTALAQPRGGGWGGGATINSRPRRATAAAPEEMTAAGRGVKGDRGAPATSAVAEGPGPEGGPDEVSVSTTSARLMGLIDDLHKVAASPSASGVAAVMSVNEQFRDPHAAITFLEKMLPEAKDDTVARAIRIQLADMYKRTDQHDKAVEQLEKLITGK